MSENALGKANSSSDATDKVFSCAACGSEHDSQRGLSIHEAQAHGGPVDDDDGINCPNDTCERSFSCQRGLIGHLTSGCGDAGHPCEECGRTFPTERGWRAHMKQEHDIDTRPVVKCEWCGDTKQIDPNHAKQSDKHFCDQECFGSWAAEEYAGEKSACYVEPVVLECEVCGDEYEVNPSREDSVVCSEECRYEWMKQFRGKNAFRWKGGSVRHYGDNWEEQRRRALERDNYTCQLCGEDMSGDGRDLDVHHLKRLKWFQDNYDAPEWWERGNSLSNLVCFCRPCHNKWEGLPVKPELV